MLNIRVIPFIIIHCLFIHQLAYSQLNQSIYDVDITPDSEGDFGVCIGDDQNKSSIRYNYYDSDEYPISDYYYMSLKAIDDINTDGLFLTQDGIVVIGTASPCLRSDQFKLYVTGDMAIEGQAYSGDGNGTWNVLSDRRLKKDIAPLKRSLEQFMTVKLYEYAYKKNNIQRYGIMAQEMEKILPNSVSRTIYDGEEVLQFNPNDLLYLHMKATQELAGDLAQANQEVEALAQENRALQSELEALKGEVNEIKELLAANGMKLSETNLKPQNRAEERPIMDMPKHQTTMLADAQPNPFTDSVNIPYDIPNNVGNAQIVVRDVSGRLIQEFPLPNSGGKGAIVFDAAPHQLTDGAYFYSLSIDHQIVETKQLLLVKGE